MCVTACSLAVHEALGRPNQTAPPVVIPLFERKLVGVRCALRYGAMIITVYGMVLLGDKAFINQGNSRGRLTASTGCGASSPYHSLSHITPSQDMAIDTDDAAGHTPVVEARHVDG